MTATKAGTMFSPETVKALYSKVKGHSSLARLSASEPVAFSGNDYFVFSADGEAALVTEGGLKPEGSSSTATVTARPFKLVYQARVSDEFLKCSEEKQLDYLTTFIEGMAKKIGRGLDIVALHGIDPKTKTDSAEQKAKCFDTVVKTTVTYTEDKPDANIKDAVAAIDEADVNGAIISKEFKSALSNMQTTTGADKYPEIGWGNTELMNIKGLPIDTNSTVTYGDAEKNKNVGYIGDFQNALRWGYAQDVTVEPIEYGSPDGGTDLKQSGEVLLRAEAYVGFAVLDPEAFARITKAA